MVPDRLAGRTCLVQFRQSMKMSKYCSSIDAKAVLGALASDGGIATNCCNGCKQVGMCKID